MPIISLRRYLNASADESSLSAAEASFRQIVCLLISGIGSSAIEGEPAELSAFKADIKEIGDGLAPNLPIENYMNFATAATRALAAYNKRIEALLAAQANEVKHILGMLQDAVIDIAGENTRSGKRLQEITLELEKSRATTDLRVLKGRLTECLKDLRAETRQEKADAAGILKKLHLTIETSRKVVSSAGGNPDSVTGLIGRGGALVAMQVAIDSGVRQYAVVMVVNRVQMVSARFGREVGDHMLIRFKEHVVGQLDSSGRLFHWGGPAFVAIIERSLPLGVVRLQAKRMMDAKIEVDYAGAGRSVLIPVSAVWSALPLTSAADAEKQIQTFVAAQSGGDYA